MVGPYVAPGKQVEICPENGIWDLSKILELRSRDPEKLEPGRVFFKEDQSTDPLTERGPEQLTAVRQYVVCRLIGVIESSTWKP